MKNHIEKYLALYAEKGPWQLTAKSCDGIHHAVVIPALAEYPTILETLFSLSLNSPEALQQTLVVCVVNNRACPEATDENIANNSKTLSILNALLKKNTYENVAPGHEYWIDGIRKSRMRLAYVDASSAGLELLAKAGVGLARKIGMDLCLSVIEHKPNGKNLLLSLDADTLVEPDYLDQVYRHFSSDRRLAAVVPFTHRKSDDDSIQGAIAAYEAYLRYYVIGLKYARSPYAFHTIGSTIVTSARGYAMVRGMPKRLAAEDFYFLNKLAKIQKMGVVDGTTVHPSPRLSTRTPFGTGQKVSRWVEEGISADLFYHPEIFTIIRNWFILIEASLHRSGPEIFKAAESIDPGLRDYLDEIRFMETWAKLKKNFPLTSNLIKQFHAWFDGLITLKLIHYLTERRYPKLTMIHAMTIMSARMGQELPEKLRIGHACAAEILDIIKNMEKTAQQCTRGVISP